MEGKIYLDNNATTFMSKQTIAAMNAWFNCGNPSSGYLAAKKSRALVAAFRNYLAASCGFINAEEYPLEMHNEDDKNSGPQREPPESAFRILFTSCASESNVTIVNMILDAWKRHRDAVPHVITSSYEHKSLLTLLHQLEEDGEIELTEVAPCPENGQILADQVRKNIRNNTALVTIMHANNELGVINNISAIADVAHCANVPFHTDTVQTFGKYKIPLCVDAFSVSFHKLYGPVGIGALIIREKLIRGYGFKAMITGTQNYGLRGGTESIPLIAAAFSGYKEIIADRPTKNMRLVALKNRIVGALSDNFTTVLYSQYHLCKRSCFIVLLSGVGDQYLHNTLLLSIVRKVPPLICNIKLRTALEDRNIIVGIGSACNTSNSKASHVLYAIGADKYIRAGTLRISLADYNTQYEVNKFLDTFIRILKANLTADCM
jgi:cysteine desulfurase